MSQRFADTHGGPADFQSSYKDVPEQQREQLAHFRAAHPPRRLNLDGVCWNYLAGGSAGDTLLLLPGAIGRAEVAFRHILEFEDDYRVIAPDYPPLPTVDRLLSGFIALLDAENVRSATVIGGSMGGGLAQCLVRKYPERVSRLILSHTGVPNPRRAQLNSFGMKVLRFIPIGLIRAALNWEVSRLLSAAGDEKRFWLVYFGELTGLITKDEALSIYERAIDLEQRYVFKPGDLNGWPGQILILESDDDPIIRPAERAALKSLYPQAQVHTFKGGGHGASIVRREEYLSRVRKFLSQS